MTLGLETFHPFADHELKSRITMKQEWIASDHPEHAATKPGPPSEFRTIVGTTSFGTGTFYQVGFESPWDQRGYWTVPASGI